MGLSQDWLFRAAKSDCALFSPCDRGDTLEPARVINQHPVPLGEDGVDGGVPCNGEGFSDPGES